ncbi:MAG: SPFH domain-containing protein [Muribaculaceae bacterium]|nr:SPFH domain-containing protein [Muribaculaceae bacterium]
MSWAIPGFAMLFFTFILIPAIIIVMMAMFAEENPGLAFGVSVPLFILFILGCMGYVVQEPNEARVMIFFGKYVGTFSKVGYYWLNPFITRRKLSLRVRNMDIDPIKVNDKQGNPVMIGMVLVWKIRDTYRAVFDIDSASSANGTFNMRALESFVSIQSDAALREVTGRFAYDTTDNASDELTLRGGGEEINELLEHKINERLGIAGMEVVEARINYLAYAPEIAAVMLRRQQATAIISAREKIVEGAVSMVEMALDKIEKDNIAEFTAAQKANMVSNLLVVLCSDEPATPVLNASSN